MATIYTNIPIEGKGKIWTAKNGATRRELVLIVNEKDFPGGIPETNKIENARVGYLDKGKHSFIFINKSNKPSNTILGIYLNNSYGYTVLNPETEIYSNSSIGGYGNSESKFGIYKLGAIIQRHTYKNRTPNEYVILTKEGWKYLGTKADILEKIETDKDARKVAELKNWTEEIQFIE